MIRFNSRNRPPTWLAIALASSVIASGCQTMSSRKTTTTATGTSTMPGAPVPGGTRTEFHREVGAEQEYNVHVELARFHEAQGDNESAVLEYQKAVDVCEKKGTILAHAALGPAQQSLAQRRMGAALDRLGRFAQAEPHYLKALKLTPKDPKVWNDAGYSDYLQNRLADAERSFKTADSLGPGNPLVLTNLGLVLAAESKTDEALAAFSRAGGAAAGHANLGYILAAMGKTDLAREHYRSALQLQPELAPARQALARLEAAPASPPTALASAARPPRPVTAATNSRASVKDPQVARTSAPKPAATTSLGDLPELPPIPPGLATAGK